MGVAQTSCIEWNDWMSACDTAPVLARSKQNGLVGSQDDKESAFPVIKPVIPNIAALASLNLLVAYVSSESKRQNSSRMFLFSTQPEKFSHF